MPKAKLCLWQTQAMWGNNSTGQVSGCLQGKPSPWCWQEGKARCGYEHTRLLLVGGRGWGRTPGLWASPQMATGSCCLAEPTNTPKLWAPHMAELGHGWVRVKGGHLSGFLPPRESPTETISVLRAVCHCLAPTQPSRSLNYHPMVLPASLASCSQTVQENNGMKHREKTNKKERPK